MCAASDQVLVAKAQSGEPRAFDQLVCRYRERVLKVALRYTNNQADAEDAAQIAFIQAYRGIAHFRSEAAFYSWLYRIAVNAASTLRSSRQKDASVFRSMAPVRSDVQEATESLKDFDTPEALALTEEVFEVVLNSIDRLCGEQRAALVMHELEGHTYQEIAEAMACPLGTVRSRMFRAREAMDRSLRGTFPEGLGRARVPSAGVALTNCCHA